VISLSSIQHLLDSVLELAVPVEGIRSAMGGSINESCLVTLSDGRELFIKTHRHDTIPGMYASEFRALELLSAPGTLDVPKPLYCDDDYLIMEAFRTGVPGPDWEEQMGRGLALLHQATSQSRFGFECNNYLGTTLQINDWQDDWVVFWRDQRLAYQFSLLKNSLPGDDPLLLAGEKLLDRLDTLLDGEKEPAVLLHGDLWSGNAAANAEGKPVIFDPASYYGHREAEIGMMRLFGGFGPRCEAAYEEVCPFQVGHDRRISIYRLYHQLNHLNLFGHSYYAGCLSAVKNLV
jgi:fructosamine-3-kinase